MPPFMIRSQSSKSCSPRGGAWNSADTRITPFPANRATATDEVCTHCHARRGGSPGQPRLLTPGPRGSYRSYGSTRNGHLATSFLCDGPERPRARKRASRSVGARREARLGAPAAPLLGAGFLAASVERDLPHTGLSVFRFSCANASRSRRALAWRCSRSDRVLRLSTSAAERNSSSTRGSSSARTSSNASGRSGRPSRECLRPSPICHPRRRSVAFGSSSTTLRLLFVLRDFVLRGFGLSAEPPRERDLPASLRRPSVGLPSLLSPRTGAAGSFD